MKAKRIVLCVIGGVLVLDTCIAAFLSNYNLGVILPGCLGLPLLLLGIFLPHTQKGTGRWIRRCLTGCDILGTALLLFLGGLMIRGATEGQGKEADGLIVLGAALHGEKVTWVLSNRLDTAAAYLKAHPGTLCVVSGGQGIDPERILTEEKASSTKENFLFSKTILEERLGREGTLAFVTTDFHVFRAGRTAAGCGIEAFGVAAPDVWYLRPNNFLRECVGICYYFVKGWI